jgi:hypothetical protein
LNKTIYDNFTSKILVAGPILQFLLIVVCNNVHYYSSSDPDSTLLFSLINLVGIVAYSSWLYSIAYVANFHIERKELNFKKLRLLEICIVVCFFLEIALTLFHFPKAMVNLDFMYFTYSEPFLLSLVYFISGLFSIIYVSKILIFAETHAEVDFSGYYKTALFLFFPFIGIWLIDKRLDRLKLLKKPVSGRDEESTDSEPAFNAAKLTEAAESEATLTKVEYACNEGILAIYQEHQNPNIGEKTFLNNKRAADGKYKIGFMNHVSVFDGKVSKLTMF